MNAVVVIGRLLQLTTALAEINAAIGQLNALLSQAQAEGRDLTNEEMVTLNDSLEVARARALAAHVT